MTNPFGAADMAAGYAAHRPPLHPRILSLAKTRCKIAAPMVRALDVGCGSGISTRALVDVARKCFGFDPAEAMLKYAAAVAPNAEFAVATAEAIPLPDASIDLITAAGSLNYVDLALFFPEAERVLTPGGILLVYDFATGSSFSLGTALDDWFSQFVDRYPWPVNEARAISPRLLSEVAPRFTLESEHFEIALTLTPDFYLDYMMTETNVAYAVRAGTPFQEIRAWCMETLHPVWRGADHDVLFRGYFACMRSVR